MMSQTQSSSWLHKSQRISRRASSASTFRNWARSFMAVVRAICAHSYIRLLASGQGRPRVGRSARATGTTVHGPRGAGGRRRVRIRGGCAAGRLAAGCRWRRANGSSWTNAPAKLAHGCARAGPGQPPVPRAIGGRHCPIHARSRERAGRARHDGGAKARDGRPGRRTYHVGGNRCDGAPVTILRRAARWVEARGPPTPREWLNTEAVSAPSQATGRGKPKARPRGKGESEGCRRASTSGNGMAPGPDHPMARCTRGLRCLTPTGSHAGLRHGLGRQKRAMVPVGMRTPCGRDHSRTALTRPVRRATSGSRSAHRTRRSRA
jgi:hypothetical protein